jgi:NAD(P)-dependent dehydrogenase (short-subunit alcohol dehydrogenase family)
MFKPQTFRLLGRSLAQSRTSAISSLSHQPARFLTTTSLLYKESDPYHDSSTANPEPAGAHEGSASRTDKQISFEYPDDEKFPREPTVQGRGGVHMQRTLASFSLEDRVAVITGGARGLGLVMGQALIASGADLAIVDLNKEEAEHSAAQLVETFKKDNPNSEQYDRSKFTGGKKEGVFRVPKVTAHYADVSNPDSVNDALANIISTHGKIDHLVTSAGFTENYDAIAYPYERMKKLWGVNVDGTYLFACGVAKHLMERKAPGSVVMIGSMSGSIVNVPQPQAPYNAAKAAIRHLAASLAVEWAHANIRVNCISPGYMLTAL